jgi:RNA binding exosome subunit
MKLAHQIKISVFIHEEENREEIYNKLLTLVPFNIKEQKRILNEDTAQGFNERKIKTYEIVLEKDRHINSFLEFLKEKLSDEQKELLLRQKESRLDNERNFFIRLDKEKLLNNEFYITDSGNCFHIKISIAAFPASREKAIEVVNQIFS